jgi:hypothetical protein
MINSTFVIFLRKLHSKSQTLVVVQYVDHVALPLTGSKSSQPSSTPWCATVLLVLPRALGPQPCTSCPKRTTLGHHLAFFSRKLHYYHPQWKTPLQHPITWTPELHKASLSHYWHTPTHPRHLHSSRTPPLPPWVPFCSNESMVLNHRTSSTPPARGNGRP